MTNHRLGVGEQAEGVCECVKGGGGCGGREIEGFRKDHLIFSRSEEVIRQLKLL